MIILEDVIKTFELFDYTSDMKEVMKKFIHHYDWAEYERCRKLCEDKGNVFEPYPELKTMMKEFIGQYMTIYILKLVHIKEHYVLVEHRYANKEFAEQELQDLKKDIPEILTDYNETKKQILTVDDVEWVLSEK